MGTLGRGLCLILTLWMAGSRSVTAVRPESPDSSSLWIRTLSSYKKTRFLTETLGVSRLRNGFTGKATRTPSGLATTWLQCVI